VLFSRSIFGELTCIPGDRGAKAIIERHPDYEKVRVKRGTLLDVDTEQDLERASRMLTPDAIRGRARPAGRP
jgi:CTP:molybdopterin cytidylyltransferase MocA